MKRRKEGEIIVQFELVNHSTSTKNAESRKRGIVRWKGDV